MEEAREALQGAMEATARCKREARRGYLDIQPMRAGVEELLQLHELHHALDAAARHDGGGHQVRQRRQLPAALVRQNRLLRVAHDGRQRAWAREREESV
jgi:fructosamine-3-kinase